MNSKLPLSALVKRGPWLIISGQLGFRKGVLLEGTHDQTHQALENMKSLLEAQGSSLAEVVKTTVFLTSMSQYDEMNAAYREHFSTNPPARTAVAVKGLPAGGLVEIEAWAYTS